jgi:hypothetical protein
VEKLKTVAFGFLGVVLAVFLFYLYVLHKQHTIMWEALNRAAKQQQTAKPTPSPDAPR